MNILGMVADIPWHMAPHQFNELSLGAKLQVCRTLPSGRFWMVVDHPWDGEGPSWVWLLTIHGISYGLDFAS